MDTMHNVDHLSKASLKLHPDHFSNHQINFFLLIARFKV